MPESVYFLFSRAPSGVAPDVFERWQNESARALLTDPRVRALRRFTMVPDVGTIPPIDYTHLALYVGPDQDAAGPFMRAAAAGDDAALEGVRSASFYGYALEAPIDLARLDHIYLVFTKPPPEVSVPDFYEWYVTHMRENLTAQGFEAAWRYALERDVVDPMAPSDAVHGAIYEVHGPLPELRASLDRAEADGRVVFPEWFPQMRLACLDCYALDGPIDAATATAPTR